MSRKQWNHGYMTGYLQHEIEQRCKDEKYAHWVKVHNYGTDKYSAYDDDPLCVSIGNCDCCGYNSYIFYDSYLICFCKPRAFNLDLKEIKSRRG